MPIRFSVITTTARFKAFKKDDDNDNDEICNNL